MTREEYIQKILAIYKLVHKPSEAQLKEAELLLEMMPDNTKPTLTIPVKEKPWVPSDVPLMYGVQIPWTDKQDNGIEYITTSTNVDNKSEVK